ncbi:MAG: hypothetical protein AAFN30_10195, partial [Actinomycetota bacterium]
MTTTSASFRSELYDGQGDELGPVATFGAQFFVFSALIYSFNVTGFEILPKITPLALLAGAFGVLFLAPRMVLHRLPISILVLTMMAWMAASVMWTDNAASTSAAIQDLMPLLVGMIICCGVISMRHLVPALLWTFRFSVALTANRALDMPVTEAEPTRMTPMPASVPSLRTRDRSKVRMVTIPSTRYGVMMFLWGNNPCQPSIVVSVAMSMWMRVSGMVSRAKAVRATLNRKVHSRAGT